MNIEHVVTGHYEFLHNGVIAILQEDLQHFSR